MNRLFLAPSCLPETPPLEIIDAAAAAGFAGVGLRLNRSPGLPFHPVVGNAALIREIKRRLADTGLQVLDVFSFYLVPDVDLESYRPALDLGAEFGAGHINVIGDDSDWQRLCGNFVRLCDTAAQAGLKVTIEFVAYRHLASLQDALRLIREAGRRDVAICIDPLHFARSGGKPADLRGLDPKLFPYAQLSDGALGPGEPDREIVRRAGPGRRDLPGEGSLPLRELFGALPRDITISAEIMQQRGAPLPPREWAKLVAASCRRFLG
jgi:sugar phosphate isomerase/epimerase